MNQLTTHQKNMIAGIAKKKNLKQEKWLTTLLSAEYKKIMQKDYWSM